jgi:hypothetical protein
VARVEQAIVSRLHVAELQPYLYGKGATSSGELGWRTYYRGTLGHGGNPASPARPYLMYGEEQGFRFSEVRETSRAQVRSFKFYVYDEPLGITRINDICPLVDETLLGLLDQQLPGGGRCTDVDLGSWGRVEKDPVQDLLVRTINCNLMTSSK